MRKKQKLEDNPIVIQELGGEEKSLHFSSKMKEHGDSEGGVNFHVGLAVAASNGPLSMSELRNQIADLKELNSAERKVTHDGKQTVLDQYIGNAIRSLKKKGHLRKTGNLVYSTEEGREFYECRIDDEENGDWMKEYSDLS